MKRLLTAIVIIFVTWGLLPCRATTTIEEAESAAIDAAQKWLALIDDGQFEKSWELSASYFKANVTLEQWIAAMKGVRVPLGAKLSRKVLTTKYMTEMPGGPDGEYVVIQFESSFQNKANAIETITPMLDKDGRWRASGYYIR
ncbi:MAG: DUF4019 domain-containing protein [Verrucomicrobia bacterium]|nr:DUF4019 domain-containing protein [Verrucomicrobiota bacterium]